MPVRVIAAKPGEGLEALSPWLVPGRTVALLGSSGVGKSTLVNRLLGREKQKTREVREADQRGRHTTTHRELILLPGGALLLDTPGLRELQLWSDGGGLEAAFEDVRGRAPACRFRDCGHVHEPGCAVRAAVEAGELAAAPAGELPQAAGRAARARDPGGPAEAPRGTRPLEGDPQVPPAPEARPLRRAIDPKLGPKAPPESQSGLGVG